MRPIVRGTGLTASERILAGMAERTFLNLWNYPNTYIDKFGKIGDSGKELCDLLVVSGNDVIIFSDKSISWPESNSNKLSWQRWYRRAIASSIDQVKGAQRWLSNFPERIFVDPKCIQKFPIDIPNSADARFHRVVIALGAEHACAKYNNEIDIDRIDCGLSINTQIRGEDHLNPQEKGQSLFSIGDVDPSGAFIHIFDKNAINVVMEEMDTISDFINYLSIRQSAIRNKWFKYSPSEADLLAFLQKGSFTNKKMEFTCPPSRIPKSYYYNWIVDDDYAAQNNLRECSYTWDRLIKVFSDSVMAGTSMSVRGHPPTAAMAEPALRIMAKENRHLRGALGMALETGVAESINKGMPRFTRIIMPNESFYDKECAYILMILNYPFAEYSPENYLKYRKVRATMLETYCLSVMHEFRNLKRSVGIGLDGFRPTKGTQGSSEDILAVEVLEWTPDLEESILENKRKLEILRPEALEFRNVSDYRMR